MLVPKAISTSSLAITKDTEITSMANKRTSLLVPAIKVKAISRPVPSMSDLRNEAIRIIKKLPAGNTAITLWAIMQYLDMSDIRLLCKYKSIKTVGQKSKQEIGQSLLYGLQSGEFKSIFQSIEDEKSKKKSGKKKNIAQAPKEHSNSKDIHINNSIKNIQVENVASLRKPAPIPTPGYSTPAYSTPGYPTPGHPTSGYPTPGYPKPGHPTSGYPTPGYSTPGYPTPVVAVGESGQWKLVDDRKYTYINIYIYIYKYKYINVYIQIYANSLMIISLYTNMFVQYISLLSYVILQA
jgi:hypothetical protein